MRFLKFINEATVNVDMTDINTRIKAIKKLDIPNLAQGIEALNSLFKDVGINFNLKSGKSLNGTGLAGGMTYNDGNIKVYLYQDFFDVIENNFVSFAMTLSRILEHELIHREQDDKINPDKLSNVQSKYYDKHIKPKDIKSYLSGKDEIMAHANSIVRKLQHDGITNEEILELLRHINEYDYQELPMHLQDYTREFKDNPKVLKRLYKYMYQYVIGDNEENV